MLKIKFPGREINQNSQFHEKIQDFQNFKKKKKKKRRRKFSKKALGLGALGLYFLGCFKKKKNHQSKFSIPSKKFRISKFFQKKKNQQSNFFNSLKEFKTSKFFKKKKISSINFFKNSRLPNFSKKKNLSINFFYLFSFLSIP